MPLAESWHIRSRSRQCAASGRSFADGETIVTALFPDPESSGYLRRDFTEEAWDDRQDDFGDAFSFWRSVYHPPVQQEKEDPMKKEDPESLLRRLVDEDEEHTENARYILAVMLERQKLLKETDSQPVPNGILRVYEHRKTGEAFLIRDPNIPLSEVEKVQEEVILLLEHGGRRPDPETFAEDAPGEATPDEEAPPEEAEAAAKPVAENPAAEDPPAAS